MIPSSKKVVKIVKNLKSYPVANAHHDMMIFMFFT